MGRLPDHLAVLFEFQPGTWTNLSAYVNLGDSSVTTSRGRGNPYEDAQTGSCSLVLDDPDGRFTPSSAVLTGGGAAPYYPYIRENKRLKVRVQHGNLVGDPSFESGVAEWSGSPFSYTACTIAASTTQFRSGIQSMLVTWPTASTGGSATQFAFSNLTVGQSYTFSAYVRVPASNPKVGIDELFGAATFVGWGTQDTGGTTGSWVRLSGTWTATASTHYFGLKNAAAATAGQTCHVDDVMLEARSSVSTYRDTGGTYDLFTGYIDSWETQFPDGYQGRTRVLVQASDRFKLLARRELRGTHEEVARAAGASAYYPLSVPDADSLATEVTDSIRTDGAGVLVSPKENVAARQRFEADTDVNLFFDGCLTFSGGLDDGPGTGAGVARLTPLDLDTSGAFEFSAGGWFRADNVALNRVLYSDDHSAVLTLGSTGTLSAVLGSASVSTVTGDYDDGQWHHVLLGATVAAGSATIGLYVDGVLVGSDTDTYTATTVAEPTATLNGVRAYGLSARKAYYSGDVSYVGWVLAEADMGSSAADLYAAGRNGLDAEAAWYRAARVAAWVGMSSSDYDLDTDTSALIGTQDVQGQSALDALQDIARAEAAPVFIAGDGRLTLHSRARRSTFTPAVTFDGTAGEVEVASVRMTLADEGLVNQVTGQVSGGPYVTVFVSDVLVDVLTDEMSAAELPPIGATISAPWSSLDQAKYAAERYLVENYEARPRFGQIVLTPFRATNDVWHNCLALELGDLARVTGLPAAFAGATQRDFFIESVTWNLSMRDATVTIDATPLDRALGEVRFDDDLTGRFGHAAGVMTVGTVSALAGTGTGTFTVATATGPLWSLDSDDWPFTVKIDEEEMTISSVSGASSPQTFTVSARGVNGTTAAAHAAGANVELWPVPVFAH